MSRSLTSVYESLSDKEKKFIKDSFNDYLTNPMVSMETLAQAIKDNTSMSSDRKGVKKLMDYLNMPERSAEVVRESRIKMAEAKVKATVDATRDETERTLFKHYNNLDGVKKKYDESSISEMSRETGVSTYLITAFLENAGVDLRDVVLYTDVIKALHAKGYTNKDIENWYLNPKMLMRNFIEKISQESGIQISPTSTYRLLRELNIVKPEEVIYYQRGTKSRNILIQNLEKLKRAGFEDRKLLASFYHENPSVTYSELIARLNGKLGEEFFTVRWLERNMVPFLPEDRLVGVSRGEIGLTEFIRSFYDGPVVTGDRSIISPKELDIVLPELGVAFEFNGDYWHSDRFISENHGVTSAEYHASKFADSLVAGFKLGFVWESEWELDTAAVKSAVRDFVLSGVLSDRLLRLS